MNWYKVKSAHVRSIIIAYERIIVTVVGEQKQIFSRPDYFSPCGTIKSRKTYNIKFINVFGSSTAQ